MHEMSICLALIEQVQEVVLNAQASRAVGITISYGPLAGIDPESLKVCFPLAAEGTLADGANLVLQRAPCRIRCSSCGKEEDSERPFDGCSSCASLDVRLLSGRELLLRSVEIETCAAPVDAGKKTK